MIFADYTEEDQKLHDFVITHNRKLKDIRTIVNNIMWSLCALCDAFEGFKFISMDEENISSIVSRYGFAPFCNDTIIKLIDKMKTQTRSSHKYHVLYAITHEYDMLPSDMLKVAKTNFAELCDK